MKYINHENKQSLTFTRSHRCLICLHLFGLQLTNKEHVHNWYQIFFHIYQGVCTGAASASSAARDMEWVLIANGIPVQY